MHTEFEYLIYLFQFVVFFIGVILRFIIIDAIY